MRSKFDYGVYKQKENYWVIQFHNIITQEKEYVGSSNNYKKACKTYSKYQFDFYAKHKYLLPKNIALDNERNIFTFAIYFEGKSRLSKKFETVQLAIKYRDNLLKCIVG